MAQQGDEDSLHRIGHAGIDGSVAHDPSEHALLKRRPTGGSAPEEKRLGRVCQDQFHDTGGMRPLSGQTAPAHLAGASDALSK
ncbi:hypothetical protein D187_006193 [Cystobacter fuscus DSM 2262]|uniref:Uncharacterized protein n=1 Tax=Cystobacter fuscus (strain ATCC 25194 / DSM 2262 / NBRC 100088 / M29) TaxID=1242864 RepID=S9QR49_CYSF2|nr:hypothetical protein [Cystobacter fuscus]EPX63784.1 hypothetical protein D187_006193 [Cystobacter fuscus DSM 2262]